jgi:hypothetical protein
MKARRLLRSTKASKRQLLSLPSSWRFKRN